MELFIRSLICAYEGIKYAFATQRNIKIQIVITILTILASVYYNISKIEWLIVVLTITSVLTLEIINTAIETVVDLVTKEYNPLAKKAKDVAAGAVLISTIMAFFIGLFIFVPKIIN